jgi:uncharacterized protein
MDQLVASPCLGICIVDPAARQCRGCLRTVDEIAGWCEASPAEKRELLAVLADRRKAAAEKEA